MAASTLDSQHVQALKRYASAIDHVATDLRGTAEHPFWEIADRVAQHVAGLDVTFLSGDADAVADAGERLRNECEISLAHGDALSAEARQRAEGWMEIARALSAVAAVIRSIESQETAAVSHG